MTARYCGVAADLWHDRGEHLPVVAVCRDHYPLLVALAAQQKVGDPPAVTLITADPRDRCTVVVPRGAARGGARVSTPDNLGVELLHRIRDHDQARPRAQQVALGPSALGVTCDRRLGYALLGMPRVRADRRHVEHRAWVGTAMHAQLEALLRDDPRYAVEQQVVVGVVDGTPIFGTCDLYDPRDAHGGGLEVRQPQQVGEGAPRPR